jgi:phosphoserine phosphatase
MADTERQHCSNLAEEASKHCEMTEEISQDGSRTIVSLSLCDESKATIGVLQIYLNENAAIDDSDRILLKELTHFASLSISNAQYHEDSLAKAHLESELGVARDIQQRTLPEEMPQIPGYDVAGLNRPAEQTSGDSFDLIASPTGNLMMLLADATGHGIGPALSVTQVRSMLRLAVRLGIDLEQLLKNINDQLTEDLPAGRFVTAFIGHLDSEGHQLRYHAAGQGPLILYRAAVDEFQLLDPTCVPLGMFPMQEVLAPTAVDLEPGDTLALITDGVFEARNAEDEELEKEPVMKILQETSHLSCAEVIQEILRSVDDHSGSAPQEDDITVMLLRRNS